MPLGQRPIDPNDLEGWRDAMRAIVSDDDLWHERQAGSLEHASGYSWANCARQTWKAWERVVGARDRGNRAVTVAFPLKQEKPRLAAG
jgi:glycosyltransferase involved in cell wall biosynthesis